MSVYGCVCVCMSVVDVPCLPLGLPRGLPRGSAAGVQVRPQQSDEEQEHKHEDEHCDTTALLGEAGSSGVHRRCRAVRHGVVLGTPSAGPDLARLGAVERRDDRGGRGTARRARLVRGGARLGGSHPYRGASRRGLRGGRAAKRSAAVCRHHSRRGAKWGVGVGGECAHTLHTWDGPALRRGGGGGTSTGPAVTKGVLCSDQNKNYFVRPGSVSVGHHLTQGCGVGWGRAGH